MPGMHRCKVSLTKDRWNFPLTHACAFRGLGGTPGWIADFVLLTDCEPRNLEVVT
jgi:hypothetical protein